MWRCAVFVAICMFASHARADADDVGFSDVGGAPAPAQPSRSADDTGFADSGFDDVVAGPAAEVVESDAPSAWTLSGSLRFDSSLRVETAQPTRIGGARQLVDLRLEWKPVLSGSLSLQLVGSVRTETDFAYSAFDDRYAQPELEAYAWHVLPRETYLRLSWPVFELSVGEQIVNFGESEILGVLDLVNPRDFRHPLFVDFGDIRMPVLMTRATLSFDRLRLEAIVVHEAYFGLTPAPLGEFSPFRRLLLENVALGMALANRELRTRHQPEQNLAEFEATQAHGRILLSLPNVDLSFIASSVLDSLGVPELPAPSAWNSAAIDFPLTHPRFTQVGTAGAWTVGAFVVRWELAFAINKPLAVRRPDTNLLIFAGARSHVGMGLFGLTWVPSLATSAALEVTQTYVQDDLPLLFPQETTQIALRFNQQFLSDRLTLAMLGMVIGVAEFNAWAARADLTYALADGLSVSLGYVTYQPSDKFGLFYGFDRHDRVFSSLRWDVVL